MLDMEKTILITGGSSDLGMEYISQNIEEYDKVILHYSHKSERFENILKTYGNKIVSIQADFSSIADVDCLVNELKEKKMMPTHILHLASPMIKSERFDQTSINEYQNMMQVSLYSIVQILKECIPFMKRQRYGRILLILSAYTTIPNPKFAAPYVTAKFALLGLMKCIAAEYASKGITINGISPQMMETKFLKELPELMIEQHKMALPFGKLIQKEDVLPLIELLLSDHTSMITGENISVGGGI